MSDHRIVSRAEAGVEPPRRPLVAARARRAELFLHHSVTPPVPDDPHEAWRKVQDAAFGRGFDDISYTFGVHLATGTILEGRSPSTVGAHTEGYNPTAHAIVLIGNLDDPDRPTMQAVDAVRWLRSQMVARDLLTSAHRFRPHRAVKATACPGRYTVAIWPEWTVAWQPPTPTPPPPAPPGNDWTEETIMALPELSRANRAAQAADPNQHQQTKNLQGLLQAANRSVAIDGDFGPATETELRSWQQAAGCVATGTATQETWRTLLGA